MKRLVYILFFLTGLMSAQNPYTNRPDLIRPLLDQFRVEALARGIEVKERLASIDSIIIMEQPLNENGKPRPGVAWTRGSRHWIHLKRKNMENPGEASRLFFHELGHSLGLIDCFTCRYNIMRGQMDDRANYLWKDEILTPIYMDQFYEAIRNPKKWNDGHTHY